MTDTALFRGIAQFALTWGCEHADGRLNVAYNVGCINYSIDVGLAMHSVLRPNEEAAILLTYLENIPPRTACRLSHLVTTDPRAAIAALEAKLGAELLARGLHTYAPYLAHRTAIHD